jgi:hypothetical protein
MGLQRQSKAKYDAKAGVWRVPKAGPQFQLTPAPHLVNDGKSNMVSDSPNAMNMIRAQQLAYLKPAWR